MVVFGGATDRGERSDELALLSVARGKLGWRLCLRTAGASWPKPRGAHTAEVVGGRIYCAGGYGPVSRWGCGPRTAPLLVGWWRGFGGDAPLRAPCYSCRCCRVHQLTWVPHLAPPTMPQGKMYHADCLSIDLQQAFGPLAAGEGPLC